MNYLVVNKKTGKVDESIVYTQNGRFMSVDEYVLFMKGSPIEPVDILFPDQEDYIVLRSTGITDKNGVEIYEGDRVKCHKFTLEAGYNLGVTEGEKEFLGYIESSVYGGTTVKMDKGDWCFVWEQEEGRHEESLEVIGSKHIKDRV